MRELEIDVRKCRDVVNVVCMNMYECVYSHICMSTEVKSSGCSGGHLVQLGTFVAGHVPFLFPLTVIPSLFDI